MSTPGRNNPCPCGSGLKYKKCHGAAQPQAAGLKPNPPSPPLQRGGADSGRSDRGGSDGVPPFEKGGRRGDLAKAGQGEAQQSGVPRSCGDCSLCCDGWLKTRVLGQDIYLGHPCPYSDGHHCTIHEKRPQDPCRVFFCGWAEAGSHLPEWMWPKESGVIVLTGRSQWRGKPVDVLVSAGRDPDQKVLAWYQAYSIENLRPFLYQRNERWFGFGPQDFLKEIAAKSARGEALWT